jgi:hypothetical protein
LTSLLAVPFATSASASPISISGGGTFSASTASSPFTGPSQTWNFAFLVDSNPVVSNVNSGSFDPAFSNFSYVLNGSPVAITPVEIKFFDAAVTGMFAICFSSACGQTANGLQFAGPQMYSGATSAPTILPGGFTSTIFVAFFGTTLYPQANVTVQAVASTPEPMTLSLMGAGLLGLGFLRRYRKI